MSSRRSRLKETGARGEAIYREKIRPLVEPAETGKFVVVDIERGDYEIDSEAVVASTRLHERRSNAVSYGVQVGSGAPYSLGLKARGPYDD